MKPTKQPSSPPLVIDEHRIVLMHYRLDNGFGEPVDTSLGGLPLTYMHNTGALLPSLERELTGRMKGDDFDLAIYPEDAYGYRDEALVTQLPREAFVDIGALHVGMRLKSKVGEHPSASANEDSASGEPQLFTVIEINDDSITVDANHPLAGQVLHFHIAIVDVREPSDAEIDEQLGEGARWTPPWIES